MTKTDFKTQIIVFKSSVENYRRTLNNENGSFTNEVRDRLIETQRSQLNQTYGKLEKYIDVLGGGVGMTYLSAFGIEGSYNDIARKASSVIQNLDRIIGRLDAMPDTEFDELLKPKSMGSSVNASGGRGGHGYDGGHGGDGGAGGSVHFVQVGKEFTSEGVTIKDLRSPHKQYWLFIGKGFWSWVKKYVLAIIVTGVVIAVVAGYILHLFGWNH